ncbi:uncharacterized [Tachysurus ichikawai]
MPGLVQESLAIKHTRIPEPPRARQLAVWGHGQLEFSPLKSAGRLLAADWMPSCHIAVNEFSSSLCTSSVRCSQKRQRTEERTSGLVGYIWQVCWSGTTLISPTGSPLDGREEKKSRKSQCMYMSL